MTSILKVSEIQDPTNSNTALTIDSSGRVLMPSRPMFRVYGPSSNQNNQNFTTDTLVNYWDTESLDIGSNFASGRFTAPISGYYFFHISLQFRDLVSNFAYLKFRKNGSNNPGSFVEAESDTTIDRWNLAMTDIIQLDATDYVEAYLQVSSDTSTDWIANESHFCGYLIG